MNKKYFLDTEFIEGFRSTGLFGKKMHTVELISLGIIDEFGGKLYCLSNEYDYKEANKWVRENVIAPIYESMVNGDQRNRFKVSSFHKTLGISLEDIRYQVLAYTNCSKKVTEQGISWQCEDNPEFYGYYADYDWVVFCSLFGTMKDLPQNYPMYCKDLKQMMDDRKLDKEWKRVNVPDPEGEHNALTDAEWNLKLYRKLITTGFGGR